MKQRRRGISLVQNVGVVKTKNILEIDFLRGNLENYVEEILSMNLCSVFFPVNFMKKNDKIKANYHIEGYRQLSSINEFETEEALNIIISLLKGMAQCECHYIFCDEYDINMETVYVDKSFSQVKLVYIPGNEITTGPEKVIELMKKLKDRSPEEGKSYIDDGIEYISNNNFSYRSYVNHFEKLRKEVYLCGIA